MSGILLIILKCLRMNVYVKRKETTKNGRLSYDSYRASLIHSDTKKIIYVLLLSLTIPENTFYAKTDFDG